jgi:Family of unknown function (DUF6510)
MERLDGNAVAGVLGEVFAFEVTEARGRCDSCGAVAFFAEAHVYAHSLAPGAVVRCSSCEAMLAVVVVAAGRTRVGLTGLTWLEAPAG